MSFLAYLLSVLVFFIGGVIGYNVSKFSLIGLLIVPFSHRVKQGIEKWSFFLGNCCWVLVGYWLAQYIFTKMVGTQPHFLLLIFLTCLKVWVVTANPDKTRRLIDGAGGIFGGILSYAFFMI
ncbi:hypothetical protein [Chitinophaga flava]|uniref:Uncharacterized protein n=1 Tax=Chitinophaga flava TaxID=2259036 RepID=A0A365Y0C8_9BACT|nr:hypothetical protein [Chitinophaga flava]RBL91711.1 hypothetical protein DF182_03645 [Chitinophaga flava]